ncbi:MAG: hypothetical protein ABGW76_02485 [Mesonia sp.]|uniref:hypothetical protein n=1 Tax=Mesonia sp. TaxID=1960830 RepID=UPI0032422027
MSFRYIIFLSFLFLFSCESPKKYSDYSEDDFYEVQGIITNIGQNNDLFDFHSIRNISFKYFLDRSEPKTGTEKNIDLFEIKGFYSLYEIQKGYPLTVFVHKDDEDISFCGPIGIVDNLNEKEQQFLKKHFQEEIDELK